LVSRTNLGPKAVVRGVARLRLSTRTRREEATERTTARTPDLRTAVLAVTAVAGGYLLGRRLFGAGGDSADSLRERAGDALPGNGVDVPIVGGGGETAPAADPSLEEVDERTMEDVEPEPAGSASGDVEERTVADAEAEPAEAGEMQVDEEVVDEVLEEEETEE
jgi:hypothetical protein